MSLNIIVAGILDTKGPEIKYLAERIRAAGANPVVVEVSLGKQMDEYKWVDYHSSDLLKEIGKTVNELHKMDRASAADTIGAAGALLIGRLVLAGQVDGIIGYSGGVGTHIITGIMRTLPVGLPKFMLSSAAGISASASYGSKDLCIMYSLFEAGLNKVSRMIINSAAFGVVGMARGYRTDISAADRPAIALLMQGVTTPCVLKAAEKMEAAGYEIMLGHATGDGGKAMEELISHGLVSGVLDLTTHEMISCIYDYMSNPGLDRMRSATRVGIPQVIAPGGLDLLIFVGRPVPEDVQAEINNGAPGRGLYLHTTDTMVTMTGCKPEEAYRLGCIFAERINKALAPVAVLVPLRGWSSADAAKSERGTGPTPLWVPDPEKPDQSLRSRRFLDGLKIKLDWTNPNIEVYTLDRHLNDVEFADFAAELMLGMLRGLWVRGTKSSLPFITPIRHA